MKFKFNFHSPGILLPVFSCVLIFLVLQKETIFQILLINYCRYIFMKLCAIVKHYRIRIIITRICYDFTAMCRKSLISTLYDMAL